MYPEQIRIWLELIKPAEPAIEWWEPLGKDLIRVSLVGGDIVLIRKDGPEIRTWRSSPSKSANWLREKL